ncbi:exodeoxyribonuclease VII large subunit [Trichlorobacter ammonificans]|uniref:Exodeoxyribonuclease 7 large subunit n=1 Tax=Trichlorobacter ammonificans TaxID=2916410 RepID=A0ABN8HHI9_9BACT|nr:exodeoxyribonuclease VII large subunit [Trichlorobacter ammonificans]CAH2031468.1 exodeoxyribonuclease VII subunit XseA [Trichlorobacter ammonificans]
MDLFAERTILTVSRLTSLVREVLEENFQQVWVEGEVSNLSRPASGHLYFTLKDSGAMVRCVMFRSSARALRFRLDEGMSLVVRGRLSLYEQRGEYQIVCDYLEPRGAGALQLAFLQLKERLAAEGLFTQERKRPLPTLPRRVGIVTSASGAAIHDILNVLGRRFASLELLIMPVRVQGDGAAQEVARAIDDFNRLEAADVLIVGRGGGSLEDLWAFNEEAVARAIHGSRIPVISAVGHETDWTIADFVADLRAPTPSAAAELVCASSEELSRRVEELAQRLNRAMGSRLTGLNERLQGLKRALHDPTLLLGHLGQRLDDLNQRLENGMEHCLHRNRERVGRLEQQLDLHHPSLTIDRLRQQVLLLAERAEHRMTAHLERLGRVQGEATARLDSLSPLKTLSRGYAVAERVADGSVVRDAGTLGAGELLKLRLHRGSARCRVEDTFTTPPA